MLIVSVTVDTIYMSFLGSITFVERILTQMLHLVLDCHIRRNLLWLWFFLIMNLNLYFSPFSPLQICGLIFFSRKHKKERRGSQKKEINQWMIHMIKVLILILLLHPLPIRALALEQHQLQTEGQAKWEKQIDPHKNISTFIVLPAISNFPFKLCAALACSRWANCSRNNIQKRSVTLLLETIVFEVKC